MALIKCEECGREISDKAKICIHCGCPIESELMNKGNRYCQIDDIKYDLKEILDKIQRGAYKEAFLELHKITGARISVGNEVNLIEYIKMYDEIPDKYECCFYSKKEESELMSDMWKMKNEMRTDSENKVRCPKCGSTQIQIINQKWSLMTGLMTNKVNRVCLKCKNKF